MTEAASYQRTRPSPAALTIVILLHTAAIGALAMSKIEVVRNSFVPIKLLPIPKDEPPPEVKADPPPKVEPQHRSEIDIPDPIVPIISQAKFETVLPPLPPLPFKPAEQIVLPQPLPPEPVRTIEPAKARGDLASRISDSDYPPSAIRNEEQGTTRFRLHVNSEGGVTECSIIASSGSVALDNATCRIMKARAKFTPARDSLGKTTADVVTAGIKWVLPDE